MIDLRFTDRASGVYQAAVSGLAEEPVRRVDLVEAVDIVAAAGKVEVEEPSSSSDPGLLDRLAALEEAMFRWTSTLQDIGEEIRKIGELMDQGAEQMERGEQQGKGFAPRLSVARRVATDLAEPVERIEHLGQMFASDLGTIDDGLRILLSRLAEEVAEEPQDLPKV